MDEPARLERLEAIQQEHARRLDGIGARIDGPPWEGSLRERLHALTDALATDRLAVAVLREAQRQNQEARNERQRAERARWSTGWRIFGAVVAIVTVVTPYVLLALGHAGG